VPGLPAEGNKKKHLQFLAAGVSQKRESAEGGNESL
jgi:hypothetical protein